MVLTGRANLECYIEDDGGTDDASGIEKNHEWNMADTVTTVRMGASVFLRFVGVVYCCI